MARNGLRSMAGLGGLSGLRVLGLEGNRITDTTELDRLSALLTLTDLSLADNLVAKKVVRRGSFRGAGVFCLDNSAVF